MCKVSDAVCKLTLAERESLSYIGTGPIRDRVPSHHADKLMKLGMVELSCGRLETTPMGRRALTISKADAAGKRRPSLWDPAHA